MDTQSSRLLALLGGVVLSLAYPLRADSIAAALMPAGGNVSGPPGSLVGWGYSITNQSASDWFLATNLDSDSFSNGTPNLLFDFPEVAPEATVSEPFDPVNGIGLYDLLWGPAAPAGFINSGDFTLSGQWYDGDPFNGGNFIVDAPDTLLPYTATVLGSASTPEPGSCILLASGILLVGCRLLYGFRRSS